MVRKSLTTVLALAMFATVAQASVIETASERFNYGLVGLDNASDGPTTHFGPTIYGLFDDTVSTSATDGPDSGTGIASQTSTIDPASYSADMSAVSTLSYSGFFGFGSSDANSEFEVEFTVSAPVDFSIDGSASVNGGGNLASVSLVRIGGVGTPTQSFANLQGTDSSIIDVDGSLLPGNYALRARVTAGESAFGDSVYSGDASANFTMTLTPEPSSLALIALGGFAALRRRRRVV